MNLPTSFTTTIRNTFGEDGKRWLAELPDLLAEASRRWELTLGEPFLLSYNYVCAATTADGTPAVLKIGVPNRELSSEIAALHLYDGEGACRLYESDPEAGMLLLERLLPGTMLCDYADDETQTAIAAEVMKRIWRPAPEGEPLITLKSWFDELAGLRPRFGGGTGPFPKGIVEQVERLIPELFAASSPPLLIHGDLHHFNILSSARGWLAIDPKGVIGPPEYEVGPLLINPWDELKGADAVRISERRIAILAECLDFDRQRIRAWAIAHSVLSAWWDLEENGAGGEYAGIFNQVKV
ncbi:MAG: aminoglycoside phosphotransferase family protein [Chloroflexi bacterium]|nr:aminoglycoside phosphotransferase family protein [Chloroflexota bacterium]